MTWAKRFLDWLDRVDPWYQTALLRYERSALEAGYRTRGRETENLRGELKCAQSYGAMKAAECDVHKEYARHFQRMYKNCCADRSKLRLEIARLKAEKLQIYEDLKKSYFFLG